MKKLKVLFVSAEVAPFSKTGGLGDVAGSLPDALRELDVDIRVVLPKYKDIPAKLLKNIKLAADFNIHLSWRTQAARVYSLNDNIYFIENNFYFGRDGFYGYGDDYERFAFFSKAAIEMLREIDFKADILHFNDWHTGLGSTYLKDEYRQVVYYSKMKSVYSIHNLHYQGVFARNILWDIGLNDGYFTDGTLEFYGNISYMKAGIVHSDAVHTVSETYAAEIQTPSYGYGMDGLLRKRGLIDNCLYGITNGIDIIANNPETDNRIYKTYNDLKGKKINKAKLQEELGLPVSDVPLFGMVTRLAEQKGLDIITLIMEELMSMDIQFVVLGTGEYRYENMLKNFAARFPEKLSTNITFNDTLAQKIYAGSDIFLMPSVYEPCGLGQLFAMRYGTIPIVRRTGGLADTVKEFKPTTKEGTGFCFNDFVASGLMWAIKQSLDIYETPDWEIIVKNALKSDFSWGKAASEYIDMYKKVAGI